MKNKEIMQNFITRILNNLDVIEEKFLTMGNFKNLSVREFHVIEAIDKNTDQNTMKQISKLLNITQGSLSTSVATLEKKKYLERKVDTKDKRIVKIYLTKLGKEANEYHRHFHERLTDEIYKKLPQKDLDGFLNSLSSIDKFLQSEDFKNNINKKLSNIAIITDSTSDLDVKRAQELGVEIIPLSVVFGDEVYTDGIDINKDDFYKLLEYSEFEPHTSQVMPETFLKTFNYCKDNNKEVIYIGISSKLSGTINSALIAKKLCNYEDIYILDSQIVSCGQQNLIELACQLRDDGKTAKEIYDILMEKRKNINLIFMADSTNYLKKGGRFLNVDSKSDNQNSLNSKSICSLVDGKIELSEVVLGRKNAFKALYNRLKNANVDYSNPIIVTYSDNKKLYNEFLEYLKVNNMSEIYIKPCKAGSIVGTHIGPNGLGISFKTK